MTSPTLDVLVRLLTFEELDRLFPAIKFLDYFLHRDAGEMCKHHLKVPKVGSFSCWRFRDHSGPHKSKGGGIKFYVWDDTGYSMVWLGISQLRDRDDD